MRNAKLWLFGALIVAALAGTMAGAVLFSNSGTAQAAAADRDHWRNHDGHWSYWHEGDKRWYYTDGTHWFYEHDGGWHVYGFDKGFGRGEGFVRGEYKVPGEKVKIVVPRHKVYHP
jgi:hypothetical protein